MKPGVRGVFALLLCGAVSACDVRDLTAPTPAVVTGSPRAASASGGTALGTATVAPPPNTSPAEVAKLGYYELGISLPESTWVMVHVSGGVNLLWNPACADMPPNWPCMDNSPTTSYGESPGFGGPVQLFNVANGVSSAVRLRGSGGAGTTPASAVGIFFQRRPGPLVGHVSMTAVYAHNSINGGGTPSWLVTGGYTVTATQIEAPFTVTESAPEPDGTRTYTAEPLPGLRFSNFPTSGQFPPGAAFWSFYPDDSPPERSWPGWQVPGCQYQLVCRYKPPVPGRMQVNAFVEWQRAIVRSKPSADGCEIQLASADSGMASMCEPQDPKLVVSCSPNPVDRGDVISCTAGAQPQSTTVSDLTWTFADSAGHQIPGPTGTVTTWGGRMVVSGMMKVTGKVNSVSTSDSVQVAVRARTWPKLHIDAQERGHGDLPLPAAVAADSDMAHTHVDFPNPAPVGEIRDGPNKGWAWVDSVPVIPVTTHLNDAWTQGSVWYQLQHKSFWQWDLNGLPLYYCGKNQIPGVFTLARRHEGAGLQQPNSHVDVFQQWINQHAAEKDVEAAVVYVPDLANVTALSDWFGGVWDQFVRGPLLSDPQQNHTNHKSAPGIVPPAAFPCKLRY
jgi:hypothetical protein